eukprot:TRINITY_DN4749_c0_g1_i1.p1 TRINITY_DN4749_c0_g1~~TRINITY_DN4749_c0_g1_i1.p1  ORF type:complete len:250 (+),score=25.53 TRINITY_DN4749_c0_g1_i1:76-825(+)
MQVDRWYRNLPIITKAYMTACCLTTLAVHLDLINALDIFLNFNLVTQKLQVWRLVTNFFFFGGFDLSFIFHMTFLVHHSRQLEEGSFRNRTADFLWLHIFGAFMLVAIDYFFFFMRWVNLLSMFLGPSLSFMVVYVWARRNPYMRMSFLGLFTFNAPYLPYVILGLESLVDHRGIMFDVLGILVGHIYFYLEDIYARYWDRRLLKTPGVLKSIFDGHEQQQAAPQPRAAGNAAPQAPQQPGAVPFGGGH